MRLSHRGKLHHSPATERPQPRPLMHFHDVSLTRDRRTVLSHLDLTVHTGEHIALIGLPTTATTHLVHLLTTHGHPTHGRLTTHAPIHHNPPTPPTTPCLLLHTDPPPTTPDPLPPHTGLLQLTLHPAPAADRILLLCEGRVTETGNHHQLLTRGGAYARLYALRRPHT
ncbi:ABC transporter ATP-binding protein [Nocardiopsis sp. LOL_012]|uniref:ABC transporter ATP-binding protein n=1 Tax=Nocardiopsis sp. LOL_012 TaxID=3345409 RepID=UPI003A8BCFFA